jgi:two-component system cell cycle response regulator DivK
MKSRFYYPTGSGSLGETRRPRGLILEELHTYRFENSKQYSSKPTVLIAEDDDDSRSMMRRLLEMKGYTVLEAGDDGRAIEVALSERPDLILIDLKLPGSDRIAVTRHLRQNDKFGSVPIVIISGWDPAEFKSEALIAGCNEYLLKPIDCNELDAMLSCYVPLSPANKSTNRIT